MAYRVSISARAAADLRSIFRTINAEYSLEAREWYNALEDLVLSLAEFPARGAAVPEGGKRRQLLHGKKPNIYRIIYVIDERKEIVTVIHIRHGARQALN